MAVPQKHDIYVQTDPEAVTFAFLLLYQAIKK